MERQRFSVSADSVPAIRRPPLRDDFENLARVVHTAGLRSSVKVPLLIENQAVVRPQAVDAVRQKPVQHGLGPLALRAGAQLEDDAASTEMEGTASAAAHEGCTVKVSGVVKDRGRRRIGAVNTVVVEAVQYLVFPLAVAAAHQLDHGSILVRAAARGGGKNRALRAEDDAGKRSPSVRVRAEGVQHPMSPLSVAAGCQLEHRASSVAEGRVHGCAIEIAGIVEDKRRVRIRTILAVEVVEDLLGPLAVGARGQFVDCAAALVAANRGVTAQNRGAVE